MLENARIMAFLATSKAEEARQFYEAVLGLTFVADEELALVFDLNGTMLRIAKVERFKPAHFTVLGLQVEAIEAELDKLLDEGIETERYQGFAQDDRGITTFADGTRVAWFKDPDGNLLSLAQFPEA